MVLVMADPDSNQSSHEYGTECNDWEMRGECKPVLQALAGFQLTEELQSVSANMAIPARSRHRKHGAALHQHDSIHTDDQGPLGEDQGN